MVVALGLGTNRGNRLGFLREGVSHLAKTEGVRLLSTSSIYESDAMLPPEAPQAWNEPFLNLVALVETRLEPVRLLERVKAIETRLGRRAGERWSPRELDIDLLATSEDSRVNAPGLALPHSGLLERPFALLPLAELAPEWRIAGVPVLEAAAKWLGRASALVPFGTRRTPLCLSQLVGVLNITPDSFSDGGHFLFAGPAATQAVHLVANGATVLDVGAESTRPKATLISAAEEWTRLEPVLEALSALKLEAKISVDTRHPEVARRAIARGAGWINDVEGFENPAMLEAVRDSDAQLVAMHSLGVPPSPDRILERERDPVGQLLEWGSRTIERFERAGIAPGRVILDPGIGFGKTPEQAFRVLGAVSALHAWGVRVLVGHSRKSFLATVTSKTAAERDLETAVLTVELARQGAHFIRVHNAEANARALAVAMLTDGIVSYAQL